MREGKLYKILGIPIIKKITKKNDSYLIRKITFLGIFMIGIGYSTHQGDSIHIVIGLTKIELFMSFTIRKGWFR